MNDAWIVARDIAGDGAQKAATKVRPSEDELAQVDQPAEENTWHEKPDFGKHKEQFTSRFKKSKEDVSNGPTLYLMRPSTNNLKGQEGCRRCRWRPGDSREHRST